jgi:hypothetical protein
MVSIPVARPGKINARGFDTCGWSLETNARGFDTWEGKVIYGMI